MRSFFSATAPQIINKPVMLPWHVSYRHSFMIGIYYIQGQLEKAIAEGEKAVALAPNDARSNILLAGVLNARARPEEAIVYAKKAMRLEPYYPAWFLAYHLAPSYDQARRYEEALAIAHKLLKRALKGDWRRQIVHRGWRLVMRGSIGWKKHKLTLQNHLKLIPIFQ